SGVAALLEVARLLSPLPACPRPILLVAYSYEEEGLLGSDAFAQREGPGIEEVINLDMVGRRHDQKIQVDGDPFIDPGALTSPLRAALGAAFGDGFGLRPPPTAKEGPESDHTSYIIRKIPAVTLTTGLHQDYHRPTDTPDKIDLEGEAFIAGATAKMA